MKTYQQARRETLANDRVIIAHDQRVAREKEIVEILRKNPQIGYLNSGKYYVFSPGGNMTVADHPAKLV